MNLTPTTACPRARSLTNQYFEEHPEAKDGVLKAYWAYHAVWHLESPGTHHFLGASRESRCSLCGRSREMVRWDDLPGACAEHPSEFPGVSVVLLEEETAAFSLLKRAESFVPGFLSRHGLSGRSLFVLHGTHGVSPEFVQGVTPGMMSEYERLRAEDAAHARASRPVEIIRVAS